MSSNYKQVILTTLLCNPSVSPSTKERILQHANDSWDWLSALVQSSLSDQCIRTVSTLLDNQLGKDIDEKLVQRKMHKSSLTINRDLIKAIQWYVQHPCVTINEVRPILNKFEQYDLSWHDFKYIVNAAIKNINSRNEFFLYFISSKKNNFIKEVASNQDSPLDFLELLAKSPCSDVIELLVSNPASSKSLLRSLAKNNWDLIEEGISKNPNLPEEFFDRIARGQNRGAKISLIERNDLDVNLVIVLSADEDDYIRKIACQKPALPEDLIRRLARDPKESVRAMIAKRNDLSPELIQELYKSRSMEIDRALAANIAITDSMRDEFVQSNDKDLLGAAFLNPRLTEIQLAKLSKEKNKSWIKTWLYDKKVICDEAIKILATVKHAEVREQVASLDVTPISVLEMLAFDIDAEVRTAVAEHPKCTDKLLREIILLHDEDGDFHLPLRIAKGKNTIEILELMVDRLLKVHNETIVNYKKLKAEGETSFIVPKDFRSLNLFYANPLASERLKATIAGIYENLAVHGEHEEGLALAHNLAQGHVPPKAAKNTLAEKFSVGKNELFFTGFASSNELSEGFVDFLVSQVA